MPISETLKVLKYETLYKTEKWWSAIVLVDSYGRKQIAFYLWNKRNDQWKRRQKFVIRKESEWSKIKKVADAYLTEISK